jgi:hypothetical protein
MGHFFFRRQTCGDCIINNLGLKAQLVLAELDNRND